MIIDLIKRIEKLEGQNNKNSNNSSKPPSGDNKKKTRSLRSKSGRKSGGQPGHAGNTLKQVSTPDHNEEHKLTTCPVTGQRLSDADESGFRIQGKRHWLHVVCSENLTYYGVSEHRGFKAINAMGVLEDFTGHLMHDCWSSYFKLDCSHALCNPHLLRELKFFEEEQQQQWTSKLKTYIWDAYNNPSQKTLKGWKNGYTRIINQGYLENPPEPPQENGKRGRKKQHPVLNLLERLWYYSDYVLSFLKEQRYPFSNNQAEQDIRMLKIQQKISGCFRTWKGAIPLARIRSYISTARKQNQNVFDALFKVNCGFPLFV